MIDRLLDNNAMRLYTFIIYHFLFADNTNASVRLQWVLSAINVERTKLCCIIRNKDNTVITKKFRSIKACTFRCGNRTAYGNRSTRYERTSSINWFYFWQGNKKGFTWRLISGAQSERSEQKLRQKERLKSYSRFSAATKLKIQSSFIRS